MRRKALSWILLPMIFFIGCNNPHSTELIINEALACSFNEMDYDYPYLYVAAWSEGLWKIDIGDANYSSTYIPVVDSIESINEVHDVTVEDDDIIISTDNGIWRSTDSGNNWTNIGDYYVMGIDRFVNSPEKIIFDKYYISEVCYSEDYGTTWDSIQTGTQSADSYIVINPYTCGEVWIYGITGGTGFGTPYLFCIDSCGKHLKLEVNMQRDLHCVDGLNHVNSIAFDPENPDNIFISVSVPNKTVFKSYDGGYTWQEALPDTMEIKVLGNDAIQSDKFYAISYDKKLYCITENFQSFQTLGNLSSILNEEPISIIHDPIQNLLLISESGGIQVVKLND